jgi:hypothetical protein
MDSRGVRPIRGRPRLARTIDAERYPVVRRPSSVVHTHEEKNPK